MRVVPILLLLVLSAGLAGCDSIFGPGKGRREPPLTALPRQLSVDERQVIQQSNRFAFGLLRETSARDTASNLFLSPFSASMALGMTMIGARGETWEGMRATLGFDGMDQDRINASYRDLAALLLSLDGRVELRLANALWLRQGFPLHDSFVQATRTYFGATARTLDFKDPASLGVINAWADRSTNGRIRTILQSIDPDVVLYLMNALYFRGTWTQQFDPRHTVPAPFHRADGTQYDVRMMGLREASVRMYADPEVEIVDLPYGREAFSMTLVVPRPGRSLEALVATLDAERWQTWMERMQPGKVSVYLPRFRLEYEGVLNETLRALGMTTALDPYAADFSGMSPLGAELYIQEVRQKTFLEVNEEGTVAAAVTSVGMGPVSAPLMFRVDRPFLAVIRERLSGTILFIGAIGAPPSA